MQEMLTTANLREHDSERDTATVGDSSKSSGEDLEGSGDTGVNETSEPSNDPVALVSSEDFETLSAKVDTLVTENVVLIVALFMVCGIMAVQTIVRSFEVF